MTQAEKGIFGGVPVKTAEPMRAHTTLGIGGPADLFIEPPDIHSLRLAMETARRRGLEVFPIGGGSNILVRGGGIGGAVVSLSAIKGVDVRSEGDEGVLLSVGAGMRLQGLIRLCRERGFSGLEGLSGIPGQIGGAVAGNAGAFGFEMKEAVEEITLVDKDGNAGVIKKDALGFGYRTSDIPAGSIIVSAGLRLKKDDPKAVSARADEFMRKKKESQPIGQRSAGCVFKNPKEGAAGRLIEDAGLKGLREGEIEVSAVHANFFINRGKGTAEDFLRLMDKVSGAVREKFGVLLEPEIRVVGRC